MNNKHHLQSTPTGPRSKVTAKELDSFSDDLPGVSMCVCAFVCVCVCVCVCVFVCA